MKNIYLIVYNTIYEIQFTVGYLANNNAKFELFYVPRSVYDPQEDAKLFKCFDVIHR